MKRLSVVRRVPTFLLYSVTCRLCELPIVIMWARNYLVGLIRQWLSLSSGWVNCFLVVSVLRLGVTLFVIVDRLSGALARRQGTFRFVFRTSCSGLLVYSGVSVCVRVTKTC